MATSCLGDDHRLLFFFHYAAVLGKRVKSPRRTTTFQINHRKLCVGAVDSCCPVGYHNKGPFSTGIWKKGSLSDHLQESNLYAESVLKCIHYLISPGELNLSACVYFRLCCICEPYSFSALCRRNHNCYANKTAYNIMYNNTGML